MRYNLLLIQGLFIAQAETHTTIKAATAKDILGCMVKLPWEVNLSLCHHILRHFPYISPPQFVSSEDQRRLPER